MTWWASGDARQPMGPQGQELARRPDRRLLGTTRAGTGPAPSQNIIRAAIVIITGSGITGLFMYQPGTTPALGNPPIASITNSTTDPFGNTTIPGGFTTYGTPAAGAASLTSTALEFWSSLTDAGPFTKVSQLLSLGNAVVLQGLGATGMQSFQVSNPQSNIVYMLPSGDTTGVLDTGNLEGFTGLVAGGKGAYLFVAPGTYYINTGHISIDQNTTGPVYIIGAGIELTKFNILGSGDGIRWFDSKTGGNAYLPGGGGITGITLDGTGMTGTGGSLIHLGDLFNFQVDFAVQNMPPAAGIMAWFDNQYLFMEQLHGRIHVHSGGNPAVQFDNSANVSGAATGSFDRTSLEILLDQKGKGNCVTFANGANITDGELGIFGNTDYGAAAYAVLTLTGSNAGGFSRITQSILNIGVECNAIIGTQPQTIKFGTTGPTGNQVFRCRGLIDFSANNAFAGSNNAESFLFYGSVYGDSKLQASDPGNISAFKFTGSGPGGDVANGDTISTKFFGVVEVTTTANVTGVKMDGFNPDDWRRVTVMNNGTGTIAFAASGTSLVASGAACVIGANTCQEFIWNPDLVLWFAVQLPDPQTVFSTTDQLINLLTFSSPCGTLAVGIGTYRIRAVLQVTQGPNANPNDFRLGFTGTISQVRMGCTFVGFGGVANNVFAVNTTSNNGLLPSPGYAIGATYRAEFDGIIVTTSTGTLSLQAAMDAAGDTFTVLALSFFRVEPVN